MDELSLVLANLNAVFGGEVLVKDRPAAIQLLKEEGKSTLVQKCINVFNSSSITTNKWVLDKF